MEIQRLRYFVALLKEKRFGKAAVATRVSQPTLSQQIALLERELGVPLVKRLRGGAVPTDAGRAFHKRAINILAELDYAAQEAAEHAGKLKGTLRLAAIPTIAPYAVPALVAGFAKANPGVTVELHERVTTDLESALQEGELDAAIVALPIKTDNLRRIVLREDELLAAVPADHPAVASGSMHWKNIADEPWLMLEESHCLGEQTRALCARQGVTPRVALRAAQLATLLEMVAHGLGVAVVPEMSRAWLPAGVRLVPFAGKRPSRTVALVMRADALAGSPALRAFAAYAKVMKQA